MRINIIAFLREIVSLIKKILVVLYRSRVFPYCNPFQAMSNIIDANEHMNGSMTCSINVSNPHLLTQTDDVFWHFGISKNEPNFAERFGDVKVGFR